jgi:hypothetical protein
MNYLVHLYNNPSYIFESIFFDKSLSRDNVTLSRDNVTLSRDNDFAILSSIEKTANGIQSFF